MKKAIKGILRILFGKKSRTIQNSITRNIKIVSFDIFDTLILRREGTPESIFIKVQRRILDWDKQFYQNRIIAEKKARQGCPGKEVTIENIYEEYRKTTGIKSSIVQKIMETEIEEELNSCYANLEIYDIYSLCIKGGKQVIITSDMYLPENIIEQILLNGGYSQYKRLYLSCVDGAAKRSGELYDTIIKEQDVRPNEILHIGDNPLSDFLVPKSKKMKALCLR